MVIRSTISNELDALPPPRRTAPNMCALVAALSLLAAACGGSATSPPTDSLVVSESITRIESSLGSTEIDSYRYVAEGVRLEPGQGAAIGEIVEVSTFTVDVTTDLTDGNFRLDWNRTMGDQTVVPGAELAYVETVNGDAGYIAGDDGVFGIGPSRPMNSSRVAAIERQQLLLQPHLLVADAIRSGSPVTLVAAGDVEIDDPRGRILLHFDDLTGQLDRVITLESDPLLGDVSVVADYGDWQQFGRVNFPLEVALSVDGVVVHHERRREVDVNVVVEPTAFALPESVTIDEASYEQGWSNAQWFNRALALPFGSGFVDQTLDAAVDVVPLSPSAVVVAGTRHNSVLVDVGESVVLIEPSINADRTRQLIDVAADSFGEKPVGHVVLTHDHHDQIGGVREAVAAGAAVVLPAEDQTFFRRVFGRARTIEPDGLEVGPTEVTIEAVDADGWSTANGAVSAHQFSSIHDEHMLVVCLRDEGLAFNSDLFNPGFGEPEAALPEPQRTFAAELLHAIDSHCPSTTGVLGSHGMPLPAPIDVVRANAGLTAGVEQ